MWDYDVYTDDVQMKTTKTISASVAQIEAKLRKYGENGWELVAVEHLVTTTQNLVAMIHYLRKRK